MHDPGAEAAVAHLEPAQIVGRADLLAKPARGLGGDDVAVQAFQPVGGVDLIVDFVAAAITQPGEVFPRRRSERHCREPGGGRNLAGVEGRYAPQGVDGAGPNRIETLERRDQSVRLEDLELQGAAGQRHDTFGEAPDGRAEDRQRARNRALQLPAHAVFGAGRAAQTAKKGDRQARP